MPTPRGNLVTVVGTLYGGRVVAGGIPISFDNAYSDYGTMPLSGAGTYDLYLTAIPPDAYVIVATLVGVTQGTTNARCNVGYELGGTLYTLAQSVATGIHAGVQFHGLALLPPGSRPYFRVVVSSGSGSASLTSTGFTIHI